ncbi:diguanylate cyclase (GGDEF)-like protein/PAS domain S-box-containing protein [Janthinobacterium sp. CG_23.3]|uniref:diguanylate cyclase n=1 Tax=unclassified Janthinobacterium TaxID=2610881 RepID=UPI000346C1F8|nr:MULTISPECIES: diguanylate cyclase [unclassified Janthinobacterium]MEC5160541.1 diguanylate cyclase (GGDEF)-like protein/PAS domain S-box-containing protein [Janthinobacterium sp. CG_S6]
MSRVLIVTADPASAGALKDVLRGDRHGGFDAAWARGLGEALDCLRGGRFDAILADLALPDGAGKAGVEALAAAAPDTPILTLGEDQALADQAMRRGAHGHFSKAHFRSALLPQSLRHVVERVALASRLARAENTLNSMGDAVVGVDLEGRVDYLNPAAEAVTGWSLAQARGLQVGEVMPLVCGAMRMPLPHPLELALGGDAPTVLAPGALLLRRDGSEAAIADSATPIHDAGERLVGAVMVFRDISATRAIGVKMAHLAQHDFLTDLPNRVLLNDRIGQAVEQAQRRGGGFAVLYVDLDNFKHVNDSLGHATGDLLLQSVARRLRASVRGADTVSRQGGDEFVVVMPDIGCATDAAVSADKVLAAMAAPHAVARHGLYVSASIGISVYPDDGHDADTLLRNADAAMYRAKARGRNNRQFFSGESNPPLIERERVDGNRRRA